MRVVCLPVSGGAFVSQLAAVSRLCEVGFTPDVCYSSSGGNVTAYIAATADWKWAKTELLASELNSSMLVQPWSKMSLLSPIIGYFKGDLYSNGGGVLSLIKKYGQEDILRKYEIWTGTYDVQKRRARFFCNLSVEQAKFKMETPLGTMDPYYMNGNIEMISKACIASASIPAIVPGQIIDNEEYADGGICSASPLTFAVLTIRKKIASLPVEERKLHLWYINCDNLESSDRNGFRYNLIDTLGQTVSDLTRMQAVTDRNLCHFLLETMSPTPLKTASGDFNSMSVKMLTGLLENIKYAMVEVYPESVVSINMVKFDGSDVKNGISKSQGILKYRLWYAPPSDRSVASLIERELLSS